MKIILTESQFKRIILKEDSSPAISDMGFEGTYNGPEFNQKGDIAHQFVNTASNLIGKKLKELYNKGKYSKVNFKDIVMSTIGMGSGNVEFHLKIPFERVDNECDAFTSFDHRGGWGHGEGKKLDDLKRELGSAPTKGTSLDISDMKKTPEGLVEYFAQWKNPNYQSHCGDNNNTKKHSIKHNNNQETLKDGLKDLGKIKLKDINHNPNQVNVITDTTSPLVSMSYIWSNADELDEVFQTVKDANPNTPPKKPLRYDINGIPGYILVFKQS